jgi:hypothetical protein
MVAFMESIQALQQVLGISPEMMVRSVLGVSSGRSGNFGPFALFVIILFTAVIGRYVFIIVMTHLRPANPFASMGRGQLMIVALLVIPTWTVALSGTGPVQARMEARILEPLGLSRAAVPPIADAHYVTGCLAGPDPAAPSPATDGQTCLASHAGEAPASAGDPARLRPRPRPEPQT